MAKFALKDLTSVESTVAISEATRNTYTFFRGQWTNVTDEKDIEYFRKNSSYIEEGLVPSAEPKDVFNEDKAKLKKAGIDEGNAITLLNKYKTFKEIKEKISLKELIDLPKIGKKQAEKIFEALLKSE